MHLLPLWQAGQQGEGLVVASLAGDGPADQSGQVKAGDVLVSIDRIDVRGMSAEDLAQYILGPPGTPVRLGFLRPGSEVRYVELTRGWTMKRSGLSVSRPLALSRAFCLCGRTASLLFLSPLSAFSRVDL